jgi:predicted PurR-regulated permease PerM
MTRKLEVLAEPVSAAAPPAGSPADNPDTVTARVSVEPPARSRQIGLTVIVLLLAMWVALPFLTPVAWAAVLGIAQWPLFQRLTGRHRIKAGWAAAICTLATALLVVFPLSLVATSLITESSGAIAWIQQIQQHGLPEPGWLRAIPIVGDRLGQWWGAHVATPEGAGALLGSAPVGSLLGWARMIAGEVAKDSGLFLVTLAALASFLVNGEHIAAQSQAIAGRTLGAFGTDFLGRLTQAVRRTVVGTVLVSVIEGALIGAGYVAAGVPQPLLFAVVTMILAFIPFGAWLAFGLAALILAGQGNLLAGALLFGFGAAVMTAGDNFVQPAVVGGAVELPFLLAFVGAFGGLATMGLVGLFIGPVIMVALLLIWREWTAGPEPAR